MPARLAIWLLALSVFLFPIEVRGENHNEANATPRPELEDAASPRQTSGIVLELIAQPRQIEIPGNISVAFRIHNVSQNNFTLKDFEFTFIDSLPMFVNYESNCIEGRMKQSVIPANSSLLIVCQVTRKNTEDNAVDFFRAIFNSWSVLTISPADYRLVAIATARQQDGTGLLVASRVISLRVVPTVWQAVIGSAIGAGLMVIFWLSAPKVERYIANRSRSENRGAAFPVVLGAYRKIRQAAALWIGATAAASIAILITFRMKDASLPFTLSVNDFYGGLVMGLFGVILTRWLSRKLFGDNDDEESAVLMGSNGASGQGGAAAQQQTQAAPALQTNALQPVPPNPPNPEGNPTR
jgi:hypothetical protein